MATWKMLVPLAAPCGHLASYVSKFVTEALDIALGARRVVRMHLVSALESS
jgi:hypothetical protein